MLIPTIAEPETSKIESFFRKLLPGSRKTTKRRARLWERRQAYRLKLRKVRTVQVEIENSDSGIFKTILNDVSAGGFSCVAPFPAGLEAGCTVRIKMRLPQDPPLLVDTEATYLEENPGQGEAGIGRFQFTQALAEEKRDEIHAYIMALQLKAVKRMKPVPATA